MLGNINNNFADFFRAMGKLEAMSMSNVTHNVHCLHLAIFVHAPNSRAGLGEHPFSPLWSGPLMNSSQSA